MRKNFIFLYFLGHEQHSFWNTATALQRSRLIKSIFPNSYWLSSVIHFRPKNYPLFVKNVCLALRGAIFIVACAMPIFVMDLKSTFPATAKGIAGYCVFFLILSYGRFVGQVLNHCVQNLSGVTLALFNIWFLSAVVGNFGPQSGAAWALFWADLILTIIFFLAFGFGMKVKSSYFILIAFLFTTFAVQASDGYANNAQNPMINMGFGLDYSVFSSTAKDSLTKPGISFWAWASCAWGILFAFLAICLPYPIFAMSQMKKEVQKANSNVAQLFAQSFDLFSATEKSLFIERWVNQVDCTSAEIKKMSRLVA